jgi:hypothetical protein
VKHLSGALALIANLRIAWKSLPGANALSYYKHSLITDVKSFITLTPGDHRKILPASLSLFRRSKDLQVK